MYQLRGALVKIISKDRPYCRMHFYKKKYKKKEEEKKSVGGGSSKSVLMAMAGVEGHIFRLDPDMTLVKQVHISVLLYTYIVCL